MASKFFIFLLISAITTSSCLGGVLHAVPAAYSLPYASSYNAHVINHAVAAPFAAPLIAAPAHLAVAPAPVAVRSHVDVGIPAAYSAFYGR